MEIRFLQTFDKAIVQISKIPKYTNKWLKSPSTYNHAFTTVQKKRCVLVDKLSRSLIHFYYIFNEWSANTAISVNNLKIKTHRFIVKIKFNVFVWLNLICIYIYKNEATKPFQTTYLLIYCGKRKSNKTDSFYC